MSPWEIWTHDFPVEGTHPCVIFTNPTRLLHPAFERFNGLLCRTLRGPRQRELNAAESLLDQADGVDWERLCRLDAVHFVLKSSLGERRPLSARSGADKSPGGG
jgi:hypothetical protein